MDRIDHDVPGAPPPLPLPPAKRQRIKYNRDAERWVWATVQQTVKYRLKIGPGYHPFDNVEIFDTKTHGRGLCARVSFLEGDVICFYGGRFRRLSDAEADPTRGTSSYDVDITEGWVMKIDETKLGEDGGLGPYCNDPNPPAYVRGVWRAKDDAEYRDRRNTEVNARIRRKTIDVGTYDDPQPLQVLLVVCILPIKPGDEIFLDYGEDYWEERRNLFVVVPEDKVK